MMLTLLLWVTLLASWLSLLFMKRDSVKRYFPVAVFTSLLVTVVFEIAYALDWWEMLAWITSWGFITNVPFVYGVFFVGTLWIFHFTYGRFWTYLLTNLLFDAFQIFVVSPYVLENRVYALHGIGRPAVFFIMAALSLVIYGYHKWQHTIFTEGGTPSPDRKREGRFIEVFLHRREKAR